MNIPHWRTDPTSWEGRHSFSIGCSRHWLKVQELLQDQVPLAALGLSICLIIYVFVLYALTHTYIYVILTRFVKNLTQTGDQFDTKDEALKGTKSKLSFEVLKIFLVLSQLKEECLNISSTPHYP